MFKFVQVLYDLSLTRNGCSFSVSDKKFAGYPMCLCPVFSFILYFHIHFVVLTEASASTPIYTSLLNITGQSHTAIDKYIYTTAGYSLLFIIAKGKSCMQCSLASLRGAGYMQCCAILLAVVLECRSVLYHCCHCCCCFRVQFLAQTG